MTTDAAQDALLNGNIPLCFDTSAIYGNRTGPALLERLRERFPKRRLLIPTWTVAEKSRKLKAEKGENFNPELIREFLDDEDLNLEVVAFDRNVALEGWLEVTRRFRPDDWGWEHRPLPTARANQPCAERCRSGDHMVYATALTHSALLVTEDTQLINQASIDNVYPGAIRASELIVLISRA